MTFSPYKNTLIKSTHFKARKKLSHKSFKLIFGTTGLLIKKQFILELFFLKFLKKKLKKLRLKGLKKKPKRQFWLFISSNFLLTKKSKNSRMGKGKGDFLRWVIRLKYGTPLLEAKNISIYRMMILKKLFIIKLKIPLCLLININKHKNLSGKQKFTWSM